MILSIILALLFSSMACSEIPSTAVAREIPIAEKKSKFFGSGDKGFEVSIFGRQMSPDEYSYSRVMKLLGSLVTDGTLAKFVVTGRGIEGGGSYCIELTSYRDMDARMQRVQTLLQEITPPEDTRYEIKTVSNCASAQLAP